MTTTDRSVLVIGGTGMLAPAVRRLLADGCRTLVVARRPERAAHVATGGGTFVPVQADWQDPRSLVDAVVAANGGERLDTAVMWVHSPYRIPIFEELDRALTPSATVVRIWGSSGQDPRIAMRAASDELTSRSIRDVVLGYERVGSGTRWLSNDEISGGVLRALDDPAPVQVIGHVDNWDARP